MDLRPRWSRRLAWFLFAIHGAATATVVAVPLDWYWRAGLLVAVLVSLGHGIGSHLFRRLPWAVSEARWEPDGAWNLVLASGRQVEARLSPSTFVATSLVVLNFRRGRWHACSLVLLPDSLDPDLLRRLRVRLRLAWGREPPDPDAPSDSDKLAPVRAEGRGKK